jgi:hypothetical protein
VGAACVAVAVGTLAWTAAAGAVTVGTGTFAAPLGAVNWRWTVTLRRWTPTDIMVKQRLDLQTPFLGHPEVSLEQDVVPERGGRLSIQTRRTAVPVDDDVMYPYDTQAMVERPTNVAGIMTRPNVRALKLHYVYTATPPVEPGTTDLIVSQPVARRTLHRTPLNFWFAGANGGAQGYTYTLRKVQGKVRICRRGHCRLYWELIYKFPRAAKVGPLGQLTPVR